MPKLYIPFSNPVYYPRGGADDLHGEFAYTSEADALAVVLLTHPEEHSILEIDTETRKCRVVRA